MPSGLHRYVAFLRAINVGGHIVKMDHLRKLFEALDFGDVETFIASGNVIFSAPSGDAAALETRIEAHLRRELGYDVATFLRTPEEVAAAARYEPFPGVELEGTSLYVIFHQRAPGADAKAKLTALESDVDSLHLHGRELYWLSRKTIATSRITGAALEKAVGMPGTNRNVTTVRKLAAKYGPE